MDIYPDSSEESAVADASRLLRNAKVKDYIEELKQAEKLKDLITIVEVIEGIKADIIGAREAKQYSAVLKGRELLGKYLKMFTDKHEHTGKDGAPIETCSLTKKEYSKIREEMIKKNDV